MRYGVAALVVVACGNTTTSSPQPSPAPNAPGGGATAGAAPSAATPAAKPVACAAGVPAAACKLQGGLRTCKDGDAERVGEWRYAIVTSQFAPLEDLPADRLAAIWKGEDKKLAIAASAETQAALETVLGLGKPTPLEAADGKLAVDDAHLAVVPAHELSPHYKVVTVAGKHPLEKAPGALAVPLCGGGKVAVHNIDPKAITIVVMTGVTAMTRFTAKLMDDKGVLYPLSAVEPWLAGADFVHISNEVSFVPKCDAGSKPTMSFCSKENYIELLEKSHANIIELTGSHLSDYGHSWLDHTLDMYKQRGWIWFGGGKDQVDGSAPRLIEHNGNKLALLGCNMVRTTSHVIAQKLDTAACDLPRLEWQIRDLRRKGYTVIVSVQHEEVYVHDPPSVVVADLREIAQAGAAFVMGSQAHCPHPWEIHHGAYVHYGPGNFYFDQDWYPVRDAAQDKLYFHANKLLAVNHLYTIVEEKGRPRLMTARERTEFLADMAKTLAKLPRAKPWEPPVDVPETRERPDSILVKGYVQPIVVKVPAKLEKDKQYPLVVELGGAPVADTDGAFVVTLPAKRVAAATTDRIAPIISEMMAEKYPIDAAQITLNTPAKPAAAKKKSKP